MLETREFSPSFSRMSSATINYMLGRGAAKVDRMFSDQSVENLRSGRLANDANILVRLAPELNGLFSVLGAKDISRVKVSRHDLPATGESPVHTDDAVIGFGMSLLVPTLGPLAIIGAGNEDFSETDIWPDYIVQYGQRDGLLVRQALREINGQSVEFGAAFHQAHREEDGQVVIIDIHTNSLNFELTEAD